MSRRRATILLHWSVQVLLLLLLASRVENTLLAALFGIAGLVFVALALVFGLMSGPGPRLEGMLAKAHPWLSCAMYAALGWASIAALAFALDITLPGPALRNLLISLFAASALHGIFNLWRHTALGDGALRRMTPKSMHGML